MSSNESQPLISSSNHIPHRPSLRNWNAGLSSYAQSSRTKAQQFLTGKLGHYYVLLLVSVDVACIFADFLINLYLCEHECCKFKEQYRSLHEAQDALGIVSLVFSSLFMVELMISIWAFRLSYFKSWFHCLDATVIVAGFVIDVCLRGILEEVGSTVVVLRLWRVFQIIEEFSTGAEEQMDSLSERIELLEKDNEKLRQEVDRLKKYSRDGGGSDN